MERKWWTLVAVCVAIFMLLIDITIVNVALPAIQSSLGASFSQLRWVIDAYALTLATCVLTAGSAGDLFGRKRVFVAGIGYSTPGAHAAFVSALNDILWVGTGVAAAGAVAAFILVRPRDFLPSGPAAPS